jgi:hypothetical protein
MGYEVQFVGQRVGVSLSLDRREIWFNCYVFEVVDGRAPRFPLSGHFYGALNGYLEKYRRYRYSYKHPVPAPAYDRNTHWVWESGRDAGLMRAHASDLVADSPEAWVPWPTPRPFLPG